MDVDVCVIGAGLAGLTTALEVARRGWSVAVLERRRIAWNASGRNCGIVGPGYAEDIRHIVARVGLDHARQLWALSQAGVDYVRARIAEGISDVDAQPGWLLVSKFDSGDALLPLVSLLGQEFGAQIEGWPCERVRASLRSERYYHGIYYPDAFNIHPLNYALGLARAAEKAGARIFEHTPALAIDPAGVRKRITTASGRLRAAHVVVAGSVHVGAIMPSLAGTLLPITAGVMVTAPLGPRLHEAIVFAGGVSDSLGPDFDFRIVGGDRLMWSGGLATWNADPRRWVAPFRRALARTFPQLGAVDVEYAWAGVMGMALHKMPQIGELAPGTWVASGFGGHGINTTAMAGELIASAIVDGDDRWRLFRPYDLMWAGDVVGRGVVQVAYWGSRLREGVALRRARRREQRRLRKVAGLESFRL
ncbi:MAG: FAD-binding oxidoreductase [Proteobacteria bacterium]|nr:FAD-binding oxidoreductase [Pseudomonadota bacterium]